MGGRAAPKLWRDKDSFSILLNYIRETRGGGGGEGVP